jgi:hypothetical protein
MNNYTENSLNKHSYANRKVIPKINFLQTISANMSEHEAMKEFVDETHFHGPRLIYTSYHHTQRWRFYFWTMVFMVALLAVVWQLVEIVRDYQEAVATKYDFVAPSKLQLPDVTVCVLHRFNKTAVYQHFDTNDSRLVEYFDALYFSTNTMAPYNEEYVGDELLSADRQNTSALEILKALSKQSCLNWLKMLHFVVRQCSINFNLV